LCSNENQEKAEAETRKNILSASLSYVPQYGWSVKTLQCGAEAVNYPGIAHGIFPNQGAELIEYFETQCNDQLNEYLLEVSSSQEPIRGGRLVQQAIERRLRMIIPYIDKWPEALMIKSYPANIPSSIERLATMMDDVWYHAGDRSTDFNWYTKRGLLAAVYCSTELYMVQDNSVDFQDTWKFLRRRFEDTRTITSSRQQLDQFAGGAFEIGTAAFTTVRVKVSL
jgi:ubiquinone biosynthesis protein COQ9